MADRKGKAPAREVPDHFEKLWNGPCPNHQYPVRHAYKDCSLLKKFLSQGQPKGEPKKKSDPTPKGKGKDGNKGDNDEGFPETDRGLTIIQGLDTRVNRPSMKE